MLLETVKSLVIRSRKRKDLRIQTQPIPGLVERSRSEPATTPSDSAHTSAHLGNAQHPITRPLDASAQVAKNSPASIRSAVSTEHLAPTPSYFTHAQNCIYNNPTVITNTIDSGGMGEFSPSFPSVL